MVRRGLIIAGGVFFLVLSVLPGAARTWGYQHAHSAIRYLEYSQETFELAKRENKPVFMVISATWCYWCRTYNENTLNTNEVAAFMNRNFVNIFVDLDQRQDLQHKYVGKGIPTSVIFTPDGRVNLSFSGILNQEQFLAGMSQVLSNIQRNSGLPAREPPATVKNVRPYLAKSSEGRRALSPAELPGAAREWRRKYLQLVLENVDLEQGGFGTQKKYPMGPVLQFLLQSLGEKGGREARKVAFETLDKVAANLYDAVEGGFYRYADRGDWRRVRREKMLRTNVQMIRAFQLGWIAARGAKMPQTARRYEGVYKNSLRFFMATFQRREGGFYSSLDGRNPGYYRLTAERRKHSRRKPKVDRTLFAAWNAEAVYMLGQIYRDDPAPEIKAALLGALNFLGQEMLTGKQGLHTYLRGREKKPTGLGLLSVNSWGAMAFITGYRITGKAAYLKQFQQVLDYADANLHLRGEGVFRLWNIQNAKGLRTGEAVSKEAPLGSNGVMALALALAAEITRNPSFKKSALEVTSALSRLELGVFDEDPNDPGKHYLNDFVFFLKALQTLSSNPA